MKNRLHKVVNFFAFNLLFFALYLNFIHKDAPNDVANNQTAAPVYTGTTPAQNVDMPGQQKANVEVARK